MKYDRNLKVNFFPLHFLIACIAFIVLVVIFSNTVFIYMSSNIYINGLIVILFIVAMMWIFGVLAYYRKSARVLSSLLSISSKLEDENSAKKTYKEASSNQRRVSEIASSVAGTLVDSPAISKALALASRNGIIELTSFDSQTILDYVDENGERVLGLSKFLTSLFTMLGLMGTFIGLLQTIDGVGKALAALSNIQNVDILGFVKLLADPLQGMAVAFSTSLFGLTAALFGNYGNYVAANSLAIFRYKLKNVLFANIGISTLNHNRIEAKDILVALDDSFNKLYMGLSDRLDLLSDSIISMVKGIARTNERQEKVFEVVLDNFETLEEAMVNLATISELPTEMRKISEDNMEDWKEFMSFEVIPLLKDIAEDSGSSADSNDMIANNTLKISDTAMDMNDVVRDLSDTAADTNNVMKDVSETTLRISDTSIDTNNVIKDISETTLRISDTSIDTNNVIKDISETTLRISDTSIDTNDVIKDISETTLKTSDVTLDLYNTLSDISGNGLKVADVVSTMSSVMNDMSGQLVNTSSDMLKAVDTFTNVSENLRVDIGSLKDSFETSAGQTTEMIGTFKDTINTVSNVASVMDNLDKSVNTLISSVSDNTAQSLNNGNNINSLVDQLNSAIEGMQNSIATVGENINSVVSNSTQVDTEMLSTLSGVQESLNNISADFANFSSQMLSNGNEGILNAITSINDANNTAYDAMVGVLRELQTQSLDANDRLDVIATVVDALITEILNSRDVTQSILNIVANDSNLTKV